VHLLHDGCPPVDGTASPDQHTIQGEDRAVHLRILPVLREQVVDFCTILRITVVVGGARCCLRTAAQQDRTHSKQLIPTHADLLSRIGKFGAIRNS
jgi:hypothetical protein